jgi:hypothetical protein
LNLPLAVATMCVFASCNDQIPRSRHVSKGECVVNLD